LIQSRSDYWLHSPVLQHSPPVPQHLAAPSPLHPHFPHVAQDERATAAKAHERRRTTFLMFFIVFYSRIKNLKPYLKKQFLPLWSKILALPVGQEVRNDRAWVKFQGCRAEDCLRCRGHDPADSKTRLPSPTKKRHPWKGWRSYNEVISRYTASGTA